jgi:hypothetical protein
MPLKSRLIGACRTAELGFESPLERVEYEALQTKFVVFHPFALETLLPGAHTACANVNRGA